MQKIITENICYFSEHAYLHIDCDDCLSKDHPGFDDRYIFLTQVLSS